MRKSRRKPFIAIGAGVILLAILFFVLTGDGLWEGKEGSTNSVIEKKKVVFLTKSMDSSFWQSAYAGAGAASAEYNLDLVCEGPDGDGEEDYEAQNEMIDRAIREQVDALLFSAIDFEKNAEAIDRAAKAGIRIVVVDSPVNSEAVECYIGTDNYEAGCMAGEEVLGNPAENLNIGIVNFDKSTENGQLREKGFRDTVLNDDRANITASINVKSTITDAREGTERMLLDNPQINVIVTFNEWTTLGVGDAVEALGAGEILLTSMDCDGTKAGYDLELTRTIAENVSIPVIASGGAGNLEHFYEALGEEGKADAALAASLFHYKELEIREVKEYLREKGVSVRL